MADGNLALNGGRPVTESSISFHEPDLGEAELNAVNTSFEDGWVAGPGPFCETVEERLQDRWDVPRVLTTTSCTHALETALLALDLDRHDEVIVPSFTFVSTALAVIRAGARPVFADIDQSTLTLSADTIREQLTDSTKAIVLVHYGGYPGPVESIKEFCSDRGLVLIEDAAQAFGSSRNGRSAGTVGRFGAFSFHGTKTITSGEGGMLVVNNPDDVSIAEMIRDKGTDRSSYLRGDVDRYTWRSTGSSYVLSDIQGAVLKAQLDRLDEITQKRRSVQAKLRETLHDVDSNGEWSILEPDTNDDVEENGHLTAFLDGDENRAGTVLEALRAEGIEARSHYQPLHQSPYAQETLKVTKTLPVTESIARRLIRLPTHTQLSPDDVESIQTALRKVHRQLVRK